MDTEVYLVRTISKRRTMDTLPGSENGLEGVSELADGAGVLYSVGLKSRQK
jgi:hypothetical protein